MKKLVILGVMMCLFGFANAQDAKTILGKVSAKYEGMKSYAVSFENNLHSPLAGIDETTKGAAVIAGEKFRIELEDHLIIVDGKSMWTFLKEDKEVNVSEYDPEESEINPSNIYKMWEKGYKYRMIDTEAIDGVKFHVLELNPEDKSNQIFKVKLWINPSDYTIKKWVMFEKSGNRYTYMISSFKANVAVSANTFKFDKSKFPGVHVEDLR